MYIFSRLSQLMINTDIESADYILSGYFLNHASLTSSMTLNSISKECFVPMSTVNRFIKNGGYANLREFRAYLEEENEEALKRKRRNGLMSDAQLQEANRFLADLKPSGVEAAKTLESCERVIIYGNTEEISCFSQLSEMLRRRGIPLVFLNDWYYAALEKKVSMLKKNDCFLFIDTSLTFSFIRYSLEVKKGTVPYSMFSAPDAEKIFICAKKGYPKKGHSFLEIPEENDMKSYILENLCTMICEAMS